MHQYVLRTWKYDIVVENNFNHIFFSIKYILFKNEDEDENPNHAFLHIVTVFNWFQIKTIFAKQPFKYIS